MKIDINDLKATIEVLANSANCDNLSEADVLKFMNRQKILKQHEERYSIRYDKTDNRWTTIVIENGKKKYLKNRKKEDLENRIVEFYSGDSTLRGVYTKWINGKCADGMSNARKLQWVWNKYYENHCLANKSIKDITVNDIKDFFRDICQKFGLNERQAKEAKSVLNMVYDFAVEEEIIYDNKARKLKNLTSNKDYITETDEPALDEEVFNDEESVAFITACYNRFETTGNTIYLMAILNFQLGLRAGESVALKFSDFKDNKLILSRSESENTYKDETGRIHRDGFKINPYLKKHVKSREVPLTPAAKEMIELIKQKNAEMGYSDSEWVCIDQNGERRHAPHFSKPLQYACDEAGITHKSNHKIRKTFISSLFVSGMSLTEIRDYAGHKDGKVTLEKYGRRIDSMDSAIEKMKNHLPTISFVKSGCWVGVEK